MGFFLGPMYPITMNVAGHILPPTMLSPAIGWITAIGNVGSALLPFATGALASAKGIWTLQPL
jgi:fucose permease